MRSSPEKNKIQPPQAAAGIVLGIFLAAVLLGGCGSPATKQKWLTFFFDGVPVQGAKTNQPSIQYDEDGRPLSTNTAPQINLTPASTPPFVSHPPYENHECGECHKSKYSPELKAAEKDVCFACHDDFLEKAKFKHPPAENGECSSCHDPHGSPFAKMVKKAGNASCFECHEESDIAAVDAHKQAKDKDCLVCHDPHVGNDQNFLRLEAAKQAPPEAPKTK